jgi:hypothetical protein
MSSSYWHPFDNKGVHAVSRGLSTPILRSISRHTRLTVLSSGDFPIDGFSPSSLREQFFFTVFRSARASCRSRVPWGPTCVMHPSSSFYVVMKIQLDARYAICILLIFFLSRDIRVCWRGVPDDRRGRILRPVNVTEAVSPHTSHFRTN